MHVRSATLFVAIAVPALICAGCSSKSTSSSSTPASTSTATVATSSAPASSTDPSAAGLVISVQISKGMVTPTNAEFEARVGEPITVRVDSDVDEELHVHSVPEHEYEIKPAAGQTFTFSVAVPGQVAIELHHSDKTVATLTVR